MMDFLVITGLALIFLSLSWSYARSVSLGRALDSIQKKMVLYGFLFVLGMGYIMVLVADLHWRRALLLPLIVGWAALLGLVAWRRRRRQRPGLEAPHRPFSAVLREGLPMVGLLVCLIGSAIEWEFVAKGEGHLLAALLWSAGVPGMIWLARRNRRATVVTALRAFLGLMIIGALAQPSLAALVAVGATGVGLVVLEKLWRKKEEPPRLHFTIGS